MKNLFKSLYPSITIEFNIASNTQIGRIVIPDKVYEFENPYHYTGNQYTRAGDFIDCLVTDNIIEYCKRWFNLAGVEDMIKDIDEFYIERTNVSYSNFIKSGWNGQAEQVMKPVFNAVETPIEFNNNFTETPVVFEILLDTNLTKELEKLYE